MKNQNTNDNSQYIQKSFLYFFSCSFKYSLILNFWINSLFLSCTLDNSLACENVMIYKKKINKEKIKLLALMNPSLLDAHRARPGNTLRINNKMDHKIHTMDWLIFNPCLRIFRITNINVRILAQINTNCYNKCDTKRR